MRRKEYDFLKGEILLFDKPCSWTSFDVVNKIRYLIRRKTGLKKLKVGHTGTLDPLATGLLLVCTGKATKHIAGLMQLEKIYEGTLQLGATTPSYDLETETDRTFPIDHITPGMIRRTADRFTGKSTQIPPVYSARRVEGAKAYLLARKGLKPKMQPKEIHIRQFEILSVALPEVSFRVCCSSGTYIRSLAFDFGKELNSGAHLTKLRRTRIGKYSVSDAFSPETFEQLLFA